MLKAVLAAGLCAAALPGATIAQDVPDVPKDADILRLDEKTLVDMAAAREKVTVALDRHWRAKGAAGRPRLFQPSAIPLHPRIGGTFSDAERRLMLYRTQTLLSYVAALPSFADPAIQLQAEPEMYRVEGEDVVLNVKVTASRGKEVGVMHLRLNPSDVRSGRPLRNAGVSPGGCRREQAPDGAFAGDESLAIGTRKAGTGLAVRGLVLDINNGNWAALADKKSIEAAAESLNGRLLAAAYGADCNRLMALANARAVPAGAELVAKADDAKLARAAALRQDIAAKAIAGWAQGSRQGRPVLDVPDEIPFDNQVKSIAPAAVKDGLYRAAVRILTHLAGLPPLASGEISLRAVPTVVTRDGVHMFRMDIWAAKGGEEGYFSINLNATSNGEPEKIAGNTAGGCRREQITEGDDAGEELLIVGDTRSRGGPLVRNVFFYTHPDAWPAFSRHASPGALAKSLDGRIVAALYSVDCNGLLAIANGR
ncbi:hypothetical protein IC614_08020 [Allosphingosinicella flava]|uniref:Uncharacterized protein n=1 Tax=Allosphingosinicella flava TaxID=2771430 RepID=A0A7T2GI64_9SPHN|nr:hypothetical protein [Sphingosinicella flava]QPQ54304.1 hypothetical protein IC614_08020 [Sphingosinicella flava]